MNEVYLHQPSDYVCPFCLVVKGIEDEENKLVQSKQQDIVYKDCVDRNFVVGKQ